MKNAPACFQRLIEAAFGDLLSIYAVAYAYYILVFSTDVKSHKLHLAAVMKLILAYNLTVELSKCTFSQESVFFLGNIVFSGGYAFAPKNKSDI